MFRLLSSSLNRDTRAVTPLHVDRNVDLTSEQVLKEAQCTWSSTACFLSVFRLLSSPNQDARAVIPLHILQSLTSSKLMPEDC